MFRGRIRKPENFLEKAVHVLEKYQNTLKRLLRKYPYEGTEERKRILRVRSRLCNAPVHMVGTSKFNVQSSKDNQKNSTKLKIKNMRCSILRDFEINLNFGTISWTVLGKFWRNEQDLKWWTLVIRGRAAGITLYSHSEI